MGRGNRGGTMFALIDCNNFFVSCERLFRPELNGRPVVVLSSNDGCAVSRSTEAKALGIPMGAPAFKYRELFRQHGVISFSGNFPLYGDISRRLMLLLTEVTPHLEAYSVDESFLDLSQLPEQDWRRWAVRLRRRIWQEIGLPVSIGVAPTKGLCKIANHRAKKDPLLAGVLNLADMPEWLVNTQLAATPLEDVWGIGWRLGPRLRAQGLQTALDIKQLSARQARQLMGGVRGAQLQLELSGVSCFPLEQAGRIRQTVSHGRMFGKDTADPLAIRAAISSLTARACYDLRRDGLTARGVYLRLRGNRHKPGSPRWSYQLKLGTPTADPGLICQQLAAGLAADPAAQQLWHRADVLLYDLSPAAQLQTDRLGYVQTRQAAAGHRRLAAVDAVNHRFGAGRIRYAAESLSDVWRPKAGSRSPAYTTSWAELPVASIGLSAYTGATRRINKTILNGRSCSDEQNT